MKAGEFEELLREYGPALSRLTAGYEREPARREDLLQEIALALWRALPGFRGDASLRTFVYRVAHNRCLSHIARRRRIRQGEEGGRRTEPSSGEEASEARTPESAADPGPDPETRADARQRARRLREALVSLPLASRQVLLLALEGLSHREIGEILGITTNHVAVRLHRARRALRKRMAESETPPGDQHD